VQKRQQRSSDLNERQPHIVEWFSQRCDIHHRCRSCRR
jgi:hypothetical protein